MAEIPEGGVGKGVLVGFGVGDGHVEGDYGDGTCPKPGLAWGKTGNRLDGSVDPGCTDVGLGWGRPFKDEQAVAKAVFRPGDGAALVDAAHAGELAEGARSGERVDKGLGFGVREGEEGAILVGGADQICPGKDWRDAPGWKDEHAAGGLGWGLLEVGPLGADECVVWLVVDLAFPGAVPGRPAACAAIGFILQSVAHHTVEVLSPICLTQTTEAFMVEFLVVVEAGNRDPDGAVVGVCPPIRDPLCRLFLRLGLSLFIEQHCEANVVVVGLVRGANMDSSDAGPVSEPGDSRG